ncbi:magnesium transporter MgtE N-terminal domain-containing protein [Nocardia sp. NPDC049149]|uniref:magnesium transporter MgtE N-terminal domain-containing protein n=1 Tax=Nocardia sp. NPDC049149 TaxID=3364315 RepID=UPI003721CE3F
MWGNTCASTPVEEMAPDDRARMLREAPAKVAKKVLAGLSPRERRMTAALLGYPEGSAGQYMTPEVIALPRNLTVEQALTMVRAKGATAETVYTLPDQVLGLDSGLVSGATGGGVLGVGGAVVSGGSCGEVSGGSGAALSGAGVVEMTGGVGTRGGALFVVGR